MATTETEEPMDCSYLETPRSEATHRLLAVLSNDIRTQGQGRGRLKHGPIEWAQRTGLDKETVEDLLSDLAEGRFVMKRQAPDGGPGAYVLVAPCKCGQTPPNNNSGPVPPDLSKPGPKPEPEALVGVSSASEPPTGSARRLHTALRANQMELEKVSDQGIHPDFFDPESSRPARRKTVRRRSWPPRKQAAVLVDEFIDTLIPSARKRGFKVTAMAINQQMLAGHLRRWIEKDGITSEEIRTMIRDFINDYGRYHRPGADPAKVFLANRRRLFDSQHERALIITQPGQSTGKRFTDPADI